MNRKLQNALKKAFEPPVPLKKQEFLDQVGQPSISALAFVCSQAAYIRKWVWVLSALLFAASFVGARLVEQELLWCISAFMPLLALSVVTEMGRSELYGMAEFELSTRFSLKSIVLARLGILGTSNLALVCCLTPLVSGTTLLQTAVYMLCPYLLTVFLGLLALRRVHSPDAGFLCLGIAAGVSVGNGLFYQAVPTYYQWRSFLWWIVVLLLLAIGTGAQCYKMVKQTEELAWS